MHKAKAEKLIKRKISRAKRCPFCGKAPQINACTDQKYTGYGSFGHYVTREPCCSATGLGQTELFFCNNWKKPDFRLWKGQVDRLINDWNTRT